MGHIFLHGAPDTDAEISRRLRTWAGLGARERDIPYLRVPCTETIHWVVSAGMCKTFGDLPFTSRGERIDWESYVGASGGNNFTITEDDLLCAHSPART